MRDKRARAATALQARFGRWVSLMRDTHDDQGASRPASPARPLSPGGAIRCRDGRPLVVPTSAITMPGTSRGGGAAASASADARDACPCGWRQRPAGRRQPGSSSAGELRAQDLAGAFGQIGGSVEAREERRQLLTDGPRSIAIHNGDVDSLARLHAVAAKLGHQLNVIAWHDKLPLVYRIDPAHAPSVAVWPAPISRSKPFSLAISNWMLPQLRPL